MNPFVVPQDVQERIRVRVQECLDISQRSFKRPFEFPTIRYDKRGQAAGEASHKDWSINLNRVLLLENLEDMIENIVPHEIAHLINSEVYRSRGYRRPSPHGSSWRSIMWSYGLVPERCHHYDTSSVKITKQKQPKHVWVCRTCGTRMLLGNKRHSNHQKGWRKYFMRGCQNHGGYIYQGLEGGAQPRPVTTAGQKFLDSGRSKKSESFRIYKADRHLGRAHVIRRFIDELAMSKAGASTYYQNAKKAFGD